MLFRLQNHCVVHTFESWVHLLAVLADERRAHLRVAVAAALTTGSLAEVLQMAKTQPKAYRDMLHEVMQEHLASEHGIVADLSAIQSVPLVGRASPPRPHARKRAKAASGRGVAGEGGASPGRGARAARRWCDADADARAYGDRDGGVDGGVDRGVSHECVNSCICMCACMDRWIWLSI